MTNKITPPFEYFSDTKSNALEAGYIYIGISGLNPETNPISVYFDSDMTAPAHQPIRTLGGYPVNGETVSRLYFSENDYSIIVKDRNGQLVYSSLSGNHTSQSITAEDTDDSRTLAQWLADLSSNHIEDYIPDGHFRYWPAGGSISGRVRVELTNTGGFFVRANYSEDCTAYQVEDGASGGIRLQRNATNSGSSSLHYIIPFSSIALDPLRGQEVTLQAAIRKHADWTGTDVTMKIIYSEEPEQAIRASNGMYSNENVILGTLNITPDTSYPAAMHTITATIPTTAVNAAVVFDIPWSGTAGADDYIEIRQVNLGKIDRAFTPRVKAIDELKASADRNYQSSYPSGLPPASALQGGGSLSNIAVTDRVNYAVALSASLRPGFICPPTFYVHATEDAQDMEIYSSAADDSINALAFKLSTSGATITNNAVVVPGEVLTAHYAAISRGI